MAKKQPTFGFSEELDLAKQWAGQDAMYPKNPVEQEEWVNRFRLALKNGEVDPSILPKSRAAATYFENVTGLTMRQIIDACEKHEAILKKLWAPEKRKQDVAAVRKTLKQAIETAKNKQDEEESKKGYQVTDEERKETRSRIAKSIKQQRKSLMSALGKAPDEESDVQPQAEPSKTPRTTRSLDNSNTLNILKRIEANTSLLEKIARADASMAEDSGERVPNGRNDETKTVGWLKQIYRTLKKGAGAAAGAVVGMPQSRQTFGFSVRELKSLLTRPIMGFLDYLTAPIRKAFGFFTNPVRFIVDKMKGLFGQKSGTDLLKVANQTKVKLLNNILKELKQINAKLAGVPGSASKNIFERMRDRISAPFIRAADKIKTTVEKAKNVISAPFVAAKSAYTNLKENVSNFKNTMKDRVLAPVRAASKIASGAKEKTGNAISGIGDIAKSFGASIKDRLSGALESITSKFSFGKKDDTQKSTASDPLAIKLLKKIEEHLHNMNDFLRKQREKEEGKDDYLKANADQADKKSGIEKMFETLKNAGKMITGLFGTITDSLKGIVPTLMKAFSGLGPQILGVLGAAFVGYKIGEQIVKPLIDDLVKWITGDANQTLGTAFFDLVNSIKEKIADALPKWMVPEWLKGTKQKDEDARNAYLEQRKLQKGREVSGKITPAPETANTVKIETKPVQPANILEKKDVVDIAKEEKKTEDMANAVASVSNQANIVNAQTTNNNAVVSLRSNVRNVEESFNAWKMRTV